MLKPEDSSHCDLTTSYICVSSDAIYLILCICYQVNLCVFCYFFFLLPLKFSWNTLLTRTFLRFHFSSFASRFVYIGCNSDLGLEAREVAYRGFQDFWIWNARKLHNVAAFPLLVARLLPKNTVVPSRSLKEFGRSYPLMVYCRSRELVLSWLEVEFFLRSNNKASWIITMATVFI